jgi:outer membrane protein W
MARKDDEGESMLKKVLTSSVIVLAMASTARAQSPKVEVSGLFGYALSDGVSGDPVVAGDGNIYDRVDPKDSMTFGFSVGFFVTPSAQVGFLWRRQMTTLEISGTTTRDLSDVDIDGYHGYLAYYFGDPEGKVRPYLMGGIGATHFGGISYTTAAGTQAGGGNTQFSSTWGAGVKVYPGRNVGFQAGLQWTPTYIKSDAEGWWCDPWWGCYVVGDAQYSNQFEFVGGVTFRF